MESCNTTEEEDMKGRKGTLSTFHVFCMSFSLLFSADRPPDSLVHRWIFDRDGQCVCCDAWTHNNILPAFYAGTGKRGEKSSDCISLGLNIGQYLSPATSLCSNMSELIMGESRRVDKCTGCRWPAEAAVEQCGKAGSC